MGPSTNMGVEEGVPCPMPHQCFLSPSVLTPNIPTLMAAPMSPQLQSILCHVQMIVPNSIMPRSACINMCMCMCTYMYV